MTYPIVLAHGACRYDFLWYGLLNIDNNDDPKLDRLHYFRGIRTMLKAKGHRVYHSNVSRGAGVDKRAEELRKNILHVMEKTGTEKVNILAHSMGGLDTRHMLFHDRNKGKIHTHVASLTTISTPHEGSPFADWATNNLMKAISLIRELGLDVQALKDLRTDSCKAFNENPDVKSFEMACSHTIKFQTYAGRKTFWSVFNPFKLSFCIIENKEGENDGLVSVRSATWKDEYFKEILEGVDHLNEVGWWAPEHLLTGEGPNALLSRIHGIYHKIAKEFP